MDTAPASADDSTGPTGEEPDPALGGSDAPPRAGHSRTNHPHMIIVRRRPAGSPSGRGSAPYRPTHPTGERNRKNVTSGGVSGQRYWYQCCKDRRHGHRRTASATRGRGPAHPQGICRTRPMADDRRAGQEGWHVGEQLPQRPGRPGRTGPERVPGLGAPGHIGTAESRRPAVGARRLTRHRGSRYRTPWEGARPRPPLTTEPRQQTTAPADCLAASARTVVNAQPKEQTMRRPPDWFAHAL